MEKDLILQNLCDAFEVLKDSWDSKSDAICKCIGETSKYDMSTALDMWLYLLQSLKREWKSDNDKEMVWKVWFSIGDSYDFSSETAYYIYPVLIRKRDLYSILYGEILVKDDYGQTSFLTYCFAWMLKEKNPNLIIDILRLYNNNLHNGDFPIGTFMRKSVEAFNDIKRHYEIKVPDDNKEVMMSFLENIKDRKERAEFMVAILSL